MSQRKAHNLRTRSGRRARHVERVRELASRLHRPMAGGAIPQRPVVAPQRLRQQVRLRNWWEWGPSWINLPGI